MNAQGIERAEIMGDWYEEINAEEAEREEALAGAPEQEPPTDEELDAMEADWLKRQEQD